ncbi:hypothetical protein SERLA73DRAFT_83025 [Serpula lacrymans var. lacrymans S7.3]|uniref:ubiquitinyl hydrolase 1 n=1 Tax=Serpula lacrymans var. lacrymans (strain S7.3) TaxID=936435 RepID=F8PG40_SERL3|nr:hypothetical protein SERLA73DRAFT_83025 [Serpula lacrymans var. lacrymans S7.3]
MTPFREPQLVGEDLVDDAGRVPGLVPPDDQGQASTAWNDQTNEWEASGDSWASGTGGYNWKPETSAWDSNHGWSGGYDTAPDYATFTTPKKVDIDGRNEDEELNWWDSTVRVWNGRPGPGMLPPVLADLLHHPDHSLFSVSVTAPDLKPTPPASGSDVPSDISPPPSADDLTYSIPHPNAYYCRKHNGWVLLLWKSSSILPPLAKSFKPHHPFPDQNRRKRTSSCIGDGEQPFGQVNKTHHFHLYEKAVDSHQLMPPFRRAEWEVAAQVKQKRRKMTVNSLTGMEGVSPVVTGEAESTGDDMDNEEEGDLLDIYVCCQCSMYCIASDVIPGIIPSKLMDDFTKDRSSNPSPGKKSEEAVMAGWETFITVIENKLWKGESRPLPIGRKTFQAKLGWSPIVREIFEYLGFHLSSISPNSTGSEEMAMVPPSTDSRTPEGRLNRSKLLRAWVELSAWLTDYHRRFAIGLKAYVPHQLWVRAESAREMYQNAIGAHPDQVPRGLIPGTLLDYEPIRGAWKALGLTPTTYSWELLAFAYMAQCRCNPIGTPDYFSHFYGIVKAMQDLGDIPPQELQNLVMEERGRYRYTYEDLQNATKTLGFGKDGALGVDLEDDVPDDFVEQAWRDTVRRAWRDTQDSSDLQRDANDAFRMIAESRGSSKLRSIWADSKHNQMNPSRAYSVLEVPQDVDETMLLTVFLMRIEEQPAQTDKMREALATISEARDSARLRQFLETGQDPGDIIAPTRPDLPRGLNQLGNTCYLNSLLQYFYTIRELREAVAPMANIDIKSLEDEKLSDDDLKRHRVGGRLVTRREILRSKKFVSQLADLFWQLEYCEAASVTPTIDLAKLALVTSRDEEDEEVDRGGTDSSNDTDATLVEDGPTRVHSADSPSSVLGKRPRDDQKADDMVIDSPKSESDGDKAGFVIVSKPNSPRRSNSPRSHRKSISQSKSADPSTSKLVEVEDVEMRESSQAVETQKPPHLPARKTNMASDSIMMFGKQHDVSECMDNCMFQIETALLKFDGLSGSQDKGSVVKRLFYGKIRQRITPMRIEGRSRASIHEKEDIFSHLPINVADNGFDIYDGLSGYFDDVVEYEGNKARMEVALVDLPPLLQVQLQRVQFNRETLQPYKSQAYVKFGETIYMDRFLDSADSQKKARSKIIQADLTARRERIRLLTQDKHAPFIPALDGALGFLSRQENIALPEVDEELIAQMNSEQDVVKLEVEELRAGITKLKEELEDIWREDTQVAYELTSVFIHRGSSPSWGHYFFYSRHLPDQPDMWFKYNDSDVAEVPKDEVLADTTGSTANPYLLVFSRKGSEVIQTVKRFDPMNLEEADA